MGFKTLTWGVKASFRGYVEGAGGSISVADGATRTDEGAIEFAAVPGGDLSIADDGSASGAMRFQGSVTFEAHGGMLKTTLSELAVEATDDGLVLTSQDAVLKQHRPAIAELSTAEVGDDGSVTLRSQITEDGMYQIADNYPPGTELDSVCLR